MGDWRRKSDKEVAQLSGQCACNTTHWVCPCQQERIAKLERLVKRLTWIELASGTQQCRHCRAVSWPDEPRHREGCIVTEGE